MHGALWLQMKTSGPVNSRAGKLIGHAWWVVIVLTTLVTALTFNVQPHVKENFTARPAGYVFPLLAVAGIAGVAFELRRRNERQAFFASCAYLTGMLTSVAFGLYPMVLPARNTAYSLTAAAAKAGDYGLKIGLVWWIFGMILIAGYSTYVYRSFAGRVTLGAGEVGTAKTIAPIAKQRAHS